MRKDLILAGLTIFAGLLLFLSLFDFKNPISIPGNIESNYFVMAAGIDKDTDGIHKFKITTIGEKFSGQSGGKSSSSQGKTPEIVVSEGNTMFETVRNFAIFKSKNLFWGHIKYLLISEEVAKENILDVLDFFIRDHELRFDIRILIVKDTTAESFIRIGDQIEQYTPDLLDGVYSNIKKLSISDEIDLIDVMETFNNTYVSTHIPVISTFSRKNSVIDPKPTTDKILEIGGGTQVGTKISEGSKSNQSSGSKEDSSSGKESDTSKGNQGSMFGGSSSSDSGSKTVDSLYQDLNGYAIFDGVKLFGYIQDYMARGLNWIHGKVGSGIIVIKDENDKPISLEILSSSSKIKTKVIDGKPEANITIEFSTNVGEVMDQAEIFTEENVKKMNEQQTEIVKKEVTSVVEYSQKNGLDILDISDALHHQQPIEWEKMSDTWKEKYKEMKITVEVKSNINRTYHIRQPIRSTGGGK